MQKVDGGGKPKPIIKSQITSRHVSQANVGIIPTGNPLRDAGALIMKQGSITNIVNGRPISSRRSPDKNQIDDDL